MSRHDERAILAKNQEFYQAFRTGDYRAMAALWSSTHVVACAHPGRGIVYGRDQVMQSWKAILSNGNAPPVEHEGAQILVQGDIAVVTCTERVLETELVASNVFVHESAGWRMVHHHAGVVSAAAPRPSRGGRLN